MNGPASSGHADDTSALTAAGHGRVHRRGRIAAIVVQPLPMRLRLPTPMPMPMPMPMPLRLRLPSPMSTPMPQWLSRSVAWLCGLGRDEALAFRTIAARCRRPSPRVAPAAARSRGAMRAPVRAPILPPRPATALALALGLSMPFAAAGAAPPTAAAAAPAATASTASTASPLHVPDTMAQRTLACTACHGEQGRATPQGYFPRIAGKPAGYLLNQLLAFRDGRRTNPTMSRLVQTMTPAYLGEIARYFGGLDLPYAPPLPAALTPAAAARAETLVRHGDAAQRLPACAQCHGSALTGVLPATPGLLGLSRDYLVAQIGDWRNGLRHAAAPDCMAEVARRLSPTDIEGLAAWLGAQPVPTPSHAVAPPADAKLPLPCGSAR
jgi:cytochrome c553